MSKSDAQLRDDALAIWRAGVAGVQPARLIPEFVQVGGETLAIGDDETSLAEVDCIAIVGGGKASGAMAAALETAIGIERLRAHRAVGLVNVPAGCDTGTAVVELNAVRPQGVNEPTAAAVASVERMLNLVASLGPRDLCFCLISGGGSALLPAPLAGLALDDKITLTRELSARGADIRQLNAVRRALSRIKGGGLARACGAARLIALILSDVPGDDLNAIASGPTTLAPPALDDALAVLHDFQLDELPAGRRAAELIRQRARDKAAPAPRSRVDNVIIGNNATAVDAAGVEAERRGYSHAMLSAREPEGLAEDVAAHHAALAQRMRAPAEPDCLITGGEPVVRLAHAGQRGRGGRNQQLALAALAALDDWRGVALVSGGVDGEDGPTDAAGAWVDARVAARAADLGLDARDYLRRNDAYNFFAQTGGLLVTGPTQTNVGDLRVLTVGR